MKLTKDQILSVVTEASQKMSDPNYSSVMVGGFVQSQTPVAQFISAHERELGGAEAIINVIFHCALIAEAFRRAGGKVREMSYEDLDAAARGEPLKRLHKAQLPLHEFILANVENEEAQKLIAMIALAIDGMS
ncbi:MAG: hypothetical protein JNL83_29650 [Myxococcales bacterium]|nr:hypothetical protein [Myxococcales bacterium]